MNKEQIPVSLKVEVQLPNGGSTAVVFVCSDLSFDTKALEERIQAEIDRLIYENIRLIMFEGMNAVVSRKK